METARRRRERQTKKEWAESLVETPEIEERKANYAHAVEGKYEYTVVTILNREHGMTDKHKMTGVLMEYARKGWRLHSVYSNELGKNAISILGGGTNSTACEDVLIFERRVED